MMMEIDEVAIKRQLWEQVFDSDLAVRSKARAEIQKEVDGLELYLHALSVSPDTHIVVTLRQLDELNLVNFVRCRV